MTTSTERQIRIAAARARRKVRATRAARSDSEARTARKAAAARAARFAGRRVGLALGSGSARGLAHIGVLRALIETGVQVEFLAGTSMGAFVGAMFAAGKLDSLESHFVDPDWQGVASLLDPVFPRSGLINGQKIGDFMRANLSMHRIEDLPIAFRAIATDIGTGEEVVIEEGDLVEAVRASIAVPGVFTPVRCDGRILVDGGLVDPVPVSPARSMGADLVIAVDLNHDIFSSRALRAAIPPNGKSMTHAMARMLESLETFESPALAQLRDWLNREPLPGIVEVLLSSIYVMQARIAQANLQLEAPEILIQPPLGAVRLMEFNRAAEIIEIGYRSAMEALDAFDPAAVRDAPERRGAAEPRDSLDPAGPSPA